MTSECKIPVSPLKISLAVLFIGLTTFFETSAQVPPPSPGGPGMLRAGGPGGPANGRFYGKIVDAVQEKGLEAASVQLFLLIPDGPGKTRDSLVSGMLTRKSGDFSLENLPVRGRYRLFVTAIGFQPLEMNLSFPQGAGAPGRAPETDLGNIKLEIDPQVLESVTVSAEKPLMQMGIDRKIFNVEKNIQSTGGSAVDVMRNIPSINVDIDGNVTLRNSAPQIFVDGRPTTLSLDQIPSDAIESVELITNPSAKFDASTGQGGILNIVLKKNRKVGYHGGIRAGIDSRARLNAGGDINVRQGKLNLFASAFMNQRKSLSWGETDRLSLAENPNTRTLQESDGTSRGSFNMARFGADFFADNRNTFTLTQSIMLGGFDNDNRNNMLYEPVGNGSFETQYRNSLSSHNFRNYTTTLGYKHLFSQPGRELTADINFSHSPSSGASDILIRSFSDLDMQLPKHAEQLQEINNNSRNRYLVLQTDYVHPLGENAKWEAGLRSQARTYRSAQYNFLNGVSRPEIDNRFEYTDYVHAAYGVFSQKIPGVLNYQVGLRVESSSYDGEQFGKARYSNNFPLSLFPSVFITKSLNERQDIQLNYSRKINRPNFFQLMPNIDFSDTLNLRTGNPSLKPEFTHSLELAYQIQYGQGNSFLANLFGKHSNNLITAYQSLMPVGDTVAFVSSYINANTAYAAGIELIFRNRITSWWEATLNTNIYYSRINGSNVAAGLENARTSSFTKWNNTLKIPGGWSAQISAEYRSRSALPVSTSNSGGGDDRRGGFRGGPPSTAIGYIGANYSVDLGIRKDLKIGKNQANISFNINDIFRTRKHIVHSEAPLFIQDEWRMRDPQVARINFSYRFGKFDASLFRRRNTRTESDSGGMEF